MTSALILLLFAPVRVACVGDDITLGEGTSNRAKNAYPAQLQRLLGDGYFVRSFGNGGKTVSKSLRGFGPAREFQPDIVIVTLGTSDAVSRSWPQVRDRFVPDLEALVRQFRRTKSSPKVFVATPPPVSRPDGRKNFSEEVLPLVRQAARECGAPLIDFHNALASRPEWSPDQVHPNDDGAWSMALEAFFAIGDTRGMKKGWTILSADSEQADEGPAMNAIDGDPATYWHTQWSPKTDKYPHELVIDLGRSTGVSGIRYTPRQDGGVNGRVKEYEVYITDDKADWGRMAAGGAIPDRLAPSVVMFESAVSGRYVKFVAKSEAHGGPWATIGELDLIPKR